MIVSSTEVQNNFGRYLMLAAKEDIIITRNGMPVAKLSALKDAAQDGGVVMEQATRYGYGGRKASYEEFLGLTKDTEGRYEYLDGEIYYLASPRTAHQVALGEIFRIFYDCFQGGECRPMVAPYDITLKRDEEDINVVQPDIMVICDLEEKLGEDDYYKGVPALLVEILSEETRSKDLIKKLDLYMSCGIREYWIVNPLNREVTVYLFEDKNIKNHSNYRRPECAQSFIFPELSVDLARVFR